MPFCHLGLKCAKPKNNSYLWKSDQYPTNPSNIGEEIKKRRFDLKMTAIQCRKILGVDKSTLVDWERGRHKPNRDHLARIRRFLKTESKGQDLAR